MNPGDANDLQRHIIDACLATGVPFIWKGRGLLLVNGEGAMAVLSDLRESGYTILGLEGFELPNIEIRPRLDLIFDADRRPEGLNPSAVLDEWERGVWVDITLG